MKFKYFLAMFLLLIYTVVCGQTTSHSLHANINRHLQKALTDTSKIAIFKFDKSIIGVFDSSYTQYDLTEEDIAKIEKVFTKSIAEHNGTLTTNRDKYNFEIDLTDTAYRRQYICAINKNGEKEVCINCFLRSSYNIAWRKSFLEFEGDGQCPSCFFRLIINLTTGKHYDFFVTHVI